MSGKIATGGAIGATAGNICAEGTPVDLVTLTGPMGEREVYVKREDMSAPYPGPEFSKLRGVAAHIAKREEEVIGVLDTYHSKAGWGVAYVCKALGKRCVVYWPRYSADPDTGLVRDQQIEANNLGAATVALPAGRSAILYHRARAHLREAVGKGSYMMPNALKLAESVEETAAEVARTDLPEDLDNGTVVISVSSGTIAAGVLKGLKEADVFPHVILHMGYSRSKEAVQKYVEEQSGAPFWLFPEVTLVDEGYSYKDQSKEVDTQLPFPANPYYDLKAWSWLERFHESVDGPILFWNIGA